MGNSADLEHHRNRRPSINGVALEGLMCVEPLKDIFFSRTDKTLLIAPDPDAEMQQVLMALDQLNSFKFLDAFILLTPRQGQDIRDESCVKE